MSDKTFISIKRKQEINIVELIESLIKMTDRERLSRTEIRRRMKQGAVYVNRVRKTDPEEFIMCGDELLRIDWGKKWGSTAFVEENSWELREIEVENGSDGINIVNLVFACMRDETHLEGSESRA